MTDEIGRINQMEINATLEDGQMIIQVSGATLVGRLKE
jgi:hypothetical protein